MSKAISIIILTLFLMGFLADGFHQNDSRYMGVPIGYISSLLIAYVFIAPARKSTRDFIYFLALFFLFLLYGTISGFFSSHSESAITYMVSWIMNIILFALLLSRKQRRNKSGENALIIIVNMIYALTILRYILGYSYDTNPFIIYNRNASGFIIVGIFVLELIFYRLQLLSKSNHKIFLLLTFILLLFFQSRSMIFAMILILLLAHQNNLVYLLKKNIAKIFILLPISVALFYFSPSGQRLIEHMPVDVSVGDIDQESYDRDRMVLLSGALQVISHNPLLGNGPGLENYLDTNSQNAEALIRNARPHNFYLSAIADFGIIGFMLLLFAFTFLYIKVNKESNYQIKLIFFPYAILLLFNEYILLPELWIFLAIIINYMKMKNPDEKSMKTNTSPY